MKEYLKYIKVQEWKFVYLMAVLAILITSSVYVYGYLAKPAGYGFIGSGPLSESDVYVYYSYIEQIKDGEWLLVDLFTTEPQSRIFLNWFWLLLGGVATLFSLPSAIVIHLARILLIPVLVVVLYVFFSFFLEKINHRRLALFLALFSSGWGVYFASIYMKFWEAEGRSSPNYPMDLWVPEFNPFLSMLYHSPHILASWIFYIFVFITLLIDSKQQQYKYSIIAGIAGFLFFQFHPYYFPSIVLIWGVYLLYLMISAKKWLWLLVKKFSIFLLISTPAFLYHFYLITFNDFYSLKSATNVTLTPRLDIVLVSYGLIALFAIWGLFLVYKKNSKINLLNKDFLLIWFIINLALLYIPLSIQRRFTEGFYIILVIFVVIALSRLNEWALENIVFWKTEVLRLVSYVLFYLFGFLLSTCFVLTFVVLNYHESPEIYYYEKNKELGWQWLEDNLGENDVVLSDFYNSRLVIAYAGQRVYWGHWSETIDIARKNKEWENFCDGNFNDDFLVTSGITYLWWGKDIAEECVFNPNLSGLLEKVYSIEGIEIFKANK